MVDGLHRRARQAGASSANLARPLSQGASMDWRRRFNEDSEFRRRVDRRIAEQIAIQKARGLTKYGPDFVGDPLQHALEEAVGLTTYLATMIEAREAEQHG